MPCSPALRVVAILTAVSSLTIGAGVGSAGAGEPTGDPGSGTAEVGAERLPFTLTPDEAPAGSEVVASGEDCGVGTRVVKVDFTDLGSTLASGEATADGTGAWETTLTIPPETLAGDYGMVATCEGDEIYDTAPFRVLASGDSLDISDDSNSMWLLLLAGLGGMLLIGGVVVTIVNRRDPGRGNRERAKG
ncbi:MAG: hypothetical protein M5U31_06755 [Acidimicrobiia bacterium]|nr:hypothetical protein [Acidimicrobiia bacterium]